MEGGVSTASGGRPSSGGDASASGGGGTGGSDSGSGGSEGGMSPTAGGMGGVAGGAGGASGGNDGGVGPTEGGAGGSGGCTPTTVTLAPIADAYIRERSSDRKKNFGTLPTLLVSGIPADRCRAAITFDWAGLPGSGKVVSARLRLIIGSRSGSVATELVARRLAQAWTEAGITWAEAAPGTAWTVAGGDVALVPSDNVSVATNAFAGLAVDLDVTRDVNGILASTEPGYGWLVMTETADSTLEFGARESTFSDARPSLVVETCP
jgi:hypothetical protein